MNERVRGKTLWFQAQKGYGFIKAEDGREIFVHYSAINMDGYKSLNEGDEVEFEIGKGPKGLQAENVVKVISNVIGGAGF